MDKFSKFVAKLDLHMQARVLGAALAIEGNTWQGLDIKPLQGRKNHFRCRIGDVRLLFVRLAPRQYKVIAAGFRGNIY